ncbi:hypothetical protein WJX74_001741 [Apatococcus lobatus]|uniref:RNase H type-1 domain-containing protein n=1 Tax=Apatococcus lobatus TaxID=904363 RepID=A0AAW1Q9C0_9CHLO
MAAEREVPFQLQLQELENGKNELYDLDLAYQIQLREALEASRKQNPEPTRVNKRPRLPATPEACIDLTTEELNPEIAARRKHLESQIGDELEQPFCPSQMESAVTLAFWGLFIPQQQPLCCIYKTPRSACAAVLQTATGGILWERRGDLSGGRSTEHVAFEALLMGLQAASELGLPDIRVHGSREVLNLGLGQDQVPRSELDLYIQKARHAIKGLRTFSRALGPNPSLLNRVRGLASELLAAPTQTPPTPKAPQQVFSCADGQAQVAEDKAGPSKLLSPASPAVSSTPSEVSVLAEPQPNSRNVLRKLAEGDKGKGWLPNQPGFPQETAGGEEERAGCSICLEEIPNAECWLLLAQLLQALSVPLRKRAGSSEDTPHPVRGQL